MTLVGFAENDAVAAFGCVRYQTNTRPQLDRPLP